MAHGSRQIEAKFHKHLKSFMKDLILVFPEDRDVRVMSSSLNIAMLDDPDNAIINGFYETIRPHEQLVLDKDDAFFYNSPDMVVAKAIPAQFQLFNKLNIYWETLNAENRNTVWTYFQLLYCLAKGFVEAV